MAVVDCRIARALQSYAITYPSPDETLLGTPVALPTTEPTDPQISYTIASGHLPTVSPAGLSYTLTAILFCGGQNTDASARTVYYRTLKNGVSVRTGSRSVNAEQYYTWRHHEYLGVQTGDVVACKLWASDTNVNWDYKALAVLLTRPGPADRALVAVAYTLATKPVLTLGNPAVIQSLLFYFRHEDRRDTDGWAAGTSTLRLQLPGATYRLGQVNRGDNILASYGSVHASYRPYYEQNTVPTAISFRPLTLRV